ncbi:MAG: NADH-quinone oxidoreductase subunit N [Verrucomicrobiota bacterium]
MIIFPELVLIVFAVALILIDAFSKEASYEVIGKGAMLGVFFAFLATFTFPAGSSFQWAELYAVDPLALFFKRFFLVTVFIVLAMSFSQAGKLVLGASESFILPLFTTTGMMLLASAVDFMTIFVALELVTISFYVLVALRRHETKSLEAGVKYLIIGALSTGFLVYGIAFVFGIAGTTKLSGLSYYLVVSPPSFGLLLAMVLVLSGIAFKLASVPFHVWAPDVYQGAPTPVTAFLSVGSKAAGIVVLLRVFFFAGFSNDALDPYLIPVLSIMAAASALLGNFAAMTQRNLKRMLGYSSIGHAGYLLMALSCVNERGIQAVLVYLVIYLLSTLLAFFVIAQHEDDIGGVDFKAYFGLAQRSPLLAFGMLVSFVSLAGIPPLAGFLGKLGVFAALWEIGNYSLLLVAIISAIAGLYYYLGVVRAMYWNQPNPDALPISLNGGSKFLVSVLACLIIVLGVWQIPLQKAVEPVIGPNSIILSEK